MYTFNKDIIFYRPKSKCTLRVMRVRQFVGVARLDKGVLRRN